MFYTIYNEILYRPLLNGLIFIYTIVPFSDLGVAIIILTVAVRLLLFPATLKMFKSQAVLRELSPKIKEIQEKYKDKKEEQARLIMALYGEHKVNPFSGCLPILLQLPVLIALYRVFWVGLSPLDTASFYYFISPPILFNASMFGLIDLTAASYALAILAGASQLVQARLMPSPEPPAPKSSKPFEPDLSKILSMQTKYVFPVLITAWSFSLPAALPLYWTTMNLLVIVEQIWIKRMIS